MRRIRKQSAKFGAGDAAKVVGKICEIGNNSVKSLIVRLDGAQTIKGCCVSTDSPSDRQLMMQVLDVSAIEKK